MAFVFLAASYCQLSLRDEHNAVAAEARTVIAIAVDHSLLLTD